MNPTDTHKNKAKAKVKTTHKAKAKTKYRPVLTDEQITHIIRLAKQALAEFKAPSPLLDSSLDLEGRRIEVNTDVINASIIATLSPFKAKIDNAAIKAAYTTEEIPYKEISLESLGATSNRGATFKEEEGSNFAVNCTSKEAYWERCYDKLKLFGSAECSLEEINSAKEHMYLNDLMTPKQVEAFEAAAELELDL